MNLKRITTICLNILLGVILVIGLLVGYSLLPVKGNFQILTVMSGSMEPIIKTGELIVIKPMLEYKVGDIITYKTNSRDGKQSNVTHRVVKIDNSNGSISYTTKGDANNAPDVNNVQGEQILGRFVFGLRYIGYLVGYIKTLPGLVIVIIIPAAIIIYEEIKKIHCEGKEILKKRRERKNTAQKSSQKSTGKSSDPKPNNLQANKSRSDKAVRDPDKSASSGLNKRGGSHAKKVKADN